MSILWADSASSGTLCTKSVYCGEICVPGDYFFSFPRGLGRRISELGLSYGACICDSKAKFVHHILSFLFLDFPVPVICCWIIFVFDCTSFFFRRNVKWRSVSSGWDVLTPQWWSQSVVIFIGIGRLKHKDKSNTKLPPRSRWQLRSSGLLRSEWW
jgi:hypothetical protein